MKSEKLIRLEESLMKIAPDKKFALAFSGGVDSSILLCAAKRMDMDVFAVTFDTKLTEGSTTVLKAQTFAESLSVPFESLCVDTLSIPEIRSNDKERCYFCKKEMFSRLKKLAQIRGYGVICDGTNADDLLEYRPGLRAKEECGVFSPVAESGLTKKDIREIGNELSLEIAKAPSSPCLLTRFPYGTYVTEEMLYSVELGEALLKQRGYEDTRLRLHGDIARIELPKGADAGTVPVDELQKILDAIGVKYITLDLLGLRSGSMDI